MAYTREVIRRVAAQRAGVALLREGDLVQARKALALAMPFETDVVSLGQWAMALAWADDPDWTWDDWTNALQGPVPELLAGVVEAGAVRAEQAGLTTRAIALREKGSA